MTASIFFSFFFSHRSIWMIMNGCRVWVNGMDSAFWMVINLYYTWENPQSSKLRWKLTIGWWRKVEEWRSILNWAIDCDPFLLCVVIKASHSLKVAAGWCTTMNSSAFVFCDCTSKVFLIIEAICLVLCMYLTNMTKSKTKIYTTVKCVLFLFFITTPPHPPCKIVKLYSNMRNPLYYIALRSRGSTVGVICAIASVCVS